MAAAARRRIRATRKVTAAAVCTATIAVLAGCGMLAAGPAPSATYTDAAGETSVASWADYPAHAGNDGDVLLDAPDQDEIEAQARALMSEVRAAIEAEAGVDLEARRPESTWFDDEFWHEQYGNGYGGDSMLITVNCCELASDGVPDRDMWPAVIAAASRVTEQHGLGSLVVEGDTGSDADREEYRDRYCTLDDGGCWLRSASAFGGYQWMWLSIQDTALDPSGDAQREADEFGWPSASIAISYGATVVRAGQADAYAEAMQPFIGLERPAATTSD